MIINHNMQAMNANRQMGVNQTNASKAMEKLSSGLRINRAGDDAAGLSISEKMRGQIRGLNQAGRNAQDGISFIQTAEGALNETQDILQRMRELAVQSSNDTNVGKDRTAIQGEMDELAKEITRIANNTEFNTQKLINGGITDTKFHVGANEGQKISLAIGAMDAFSLGVSGSSITETVAGTGSVTKATATGNAEAIVDGNTITVKVSEVPAVVGANGSITVQGVTIATDSETDAYNDYKITIADNTTEGIAIDHDAKTIVITSDISNTATAAGSLSVTSSGTAPVGAGSLTFSGTATAVDATDKTIGADGTAGATEKDASFKVTLSDGTNTDSVITGLAAGATSVTGTDAFAGITLTLDGTLADGDTNTITLAITGGAAAVIGEDGVVTTEAQTTGGIDVSTQAAASTAVTTINNAIETVSAERSKLGAYQNRLEHTIKNLSTSAENLQASESRIRDVDMAKEMMEMSKDNILQQAAQAMLAQANQAPQQVLQLLR